VKDLEQHRDKLLTDAEQDAAMSEVAEDVLKRTLYDSLAAHMRALATEIQRAVDE
jgi:hypothetical protein